MPEFLTTLATTARIESIISKAKKHIILVSPYLRWSPLLFERLQEADRRNIPIVFIYGKNDLHPEQRTLLSKIKNLSLFFSRNLHAKCYFNEQELIISSLNLHEYSERNNREMSVVFQAHEGVFGEAATEVQLIMEAADLESGRPIALTRKSAAPQKSSNSGNAHPRRNRNDGYCIRCRQPIPSDRAQPHCDPCESIWAAYSNFEYEECFCHACGRSWSTCRARPLCRECFYESNSF